jgi:predicted type IV restriction endonuclease
MRMGAGKKHSEAVPEKGLMKEDLLDIRAGIKAGRYVNEATVSQGVVQRLLHALGWPVYDTEVVAPEYSLGGRRADYALCHPPREPVILIEVKQVGQSKGADRQLFEYAFHRGVPMVILTDGQEWNFFLPTEQGDYSERQLYKLDILERDPHETESSLKRYLEYEAVRSGQAIEAARRDYRNAARKRRAERTLPDAWTKLVESEDELLVELLSDKVEDLCGVKPDPDAVSIFLRGRAVIRSEMPSTTLPQRPRRAEQTAPTGDIPKFIGYELYGQRRRARNARDVLIQVFRELAERDPSFLERFAALPKHGRKRRYLARIREELYPGSTHLADNAYEVRPGWWIDTHASRAGIETRIKMACEVAGVRYGEDLLVKLG